MKDLANERDAVRRRVEAFNFEPINAEAWLPNGARSWERIANEISSSHLFVLLLGDRYGWIPDSGPGGELGLAVTHLEYREALRLGLPVLPFARRLAYDTDRTSEDARSRDAFRKEVADWAEGRFITEFELASDLAEKVGDALLGLLQDEYLSGRIRARSGQAEEAARELEPPDRGSRRPPPLPAPLCDAVARREAVLFAGAGISQPAGIPSAHVFTTLMAELLRERDPDYDVSPVGSAFAAVATDLESLANRDVLVSRMRRIVDPPQGLDPTSAHRDAVGLFDLIFTTNWDELFEAAAAALGKPLPVLAAELPAGDWPQRALIKLHGALTDPSSLLMTETDVLLMDVTRPELWRRTIALFEERPVVVLGSSLRDPSVARLFAQVGRVREGYYVAPRLFGPTVTRMQRLGFTCIETDANTFMTSLVEAIRH